MSCIICLIANTFEMQVPTQTFVVNFLTGFVVRRGSCSALRSLPVPLNFFNSLLILHDGCQTRKDILQPQGLLERYCSDQKIIRSRQGTRRNRKKVAVQASALADLPPHTEARKSRAPRFKECSFHAIAARYQNAFPCTVHALFVS